MAEGGENLPPDNQDQQPPEFVLSPRIMDAIRAVEQLEGDPKTLWSLLYAVQAAYLREAMPTPAPLAQLMAKRLQAVAVHLQKSQSTRDGLVDALAPSLETPVGRKRGRRPNPVQGMLTDLAKTALFLAGPNPTPEELHDCAWRVAGWQSHYKVSAILTEMRKLRRQKV
ncbi:hypothetical protein FJY94_06225 [Candidatus Kaiserbacteria bacterium]|nr:hypothetical protein [Candidatus Kaiserbacteria bacterium]